MLGHTKEFVWEKAFGDFNVRYSLLSKQSTESAETFYGCLLEKTEISGALLEEEWAVTGSKEAALSVLKRLYEAEVTPMGLIDVIDEAVMREEMLA